VTSLTLSFDLFLQTVDAIAHTPAVHLELRFTRPTPANATRESRKRRILPRNQAWQQIL
jgi:hypothetical protein